MPLTDRLHQRRRARAEGRDAANAAVFAVLDAWPDHTPLDASLRAAIRDALEVAAEWEAAENETLPRRHRRYRASGFDEVATHVSTLLDAAGARQATGRDLLTIGALVAGLAAVHP
ncbi:hypothetical protein [Nocardioides sp. Leaf285]|uniref:hypothetical protein n=1 Tax=Nocardioides sp. Leaf285 TaxID=1736322 RepID=UPI00070317D4|nr:hypothetical protein [Nocardioides sp. Leaf285]KQP62854.1 hypothetical protein ASF47_17735 [Nocardioides sp. Leaf285]